MKLSIFGLGYVGTVSAACFAARGNTVIGVDINSTKVELINAGRAPIVEREIDEIVKEAVGSKRLRATTETAQAVLDSDLSIVCVGTPSAANGAIETAALAKVCWEIGVALAQKDSRHTVVIRSTMTPGTFRNIVVRELEAGSAKTAGKDFGVGVNPEFLREGTAVSDFHNPEKTVVGADDAATLDVIAKLYDGLPGVVVRTAPEIAEFVKYVDNPWHALKVAFSNEIGNVCKAVGIDSHDVMDIFFLDKKLNISTAYLKPGFAFGGSCLPKDVRALSYLARSVNVSVPVVDAIMPSNAIQIERAVDWILSSGKRRIGMLGCSFKAGTDDMRESPYILVIERLLGKGCDVKIFDPNVRMSMVMGANRDFVTSVIPHIAGLIVPSAVEALADVDVVLLTAHSAEYLEALTSLTEDQTLLDFSRAAFKRGFPGQYDGVNW